MHGDSIEKLEELITLSDTMFIYNIWIVNGAVAMQVKEHI